MKKLLLLGGSHAEIPLIKAAKEMGYYVITSGNQRNGIGHSFADEYAPCDFSDKEAITSLQNNCRLMQFVLAAMILPHYLQRMPVNAWDLVDTMRIKRH